VKKILKIVGFLFLALVIGVLIFGYSINEKVPIGIESPVADQMVQSIYTNLNKTAWDSTQWVKWTFPRGHHYLWDKQNNRVQVKWDDIEVVLDLNTQKGIVKKAGIVLTGKESEKDSKKAYSMFCNDSFWLTAPFKLTDPNTTRTVVTFPDGRKGLKVSYGNGGVTPGDSYVWFLDEKGMPTSFKMWVSIIPIGGVTATWDNWVTLSTGAKLAASHLIGGKVESIATNIEGGMGMPSF
jgi:phage baseplate assembly protein gpV